MTEESFATKYNIANKTSYALAFVNLKSPELFKAVYEVVLNKLNTDEHCLVFEQEKLALLLKAYTEEQIHSRVIEIVTAVQAKTNSDIGVGIMPLWKNPPSLSTALGKARLACEGSAHAKYQSSHYEIYGISYFEPKNDFYELRDKIPPALKAGDFKLFLQPKVCLKTGEVYKAEALMRWIDPKDGVIPLNRFIDGLEREGSIRDVDLYLFNILCHYLKAWCTNFDKKICVSVNLSKAYFEDEDFLKEYTLVLNRHKLPADLIEIEFLESIVSERTKRMKSLTKQLKSLGFHCALDDFGSGYSSFNLLSQIDFDEIKLDRSLFRDFNNPKEKAVISHIISLAKSLNANTVAEGVEINDYAEFLKETGCDYIQGFVYFKPMPVEEFERRFILCNEAAKLV